MKLRFILVLTFVFWAMPCRAEISFSYLESDLGMKEIRDMHRDSFGFLWIANLGVGLVRYDGYEFKFYQYQRDVDGSLSGNFVNDVHEDYERLLWVATRSGLNRYDRSMDEFVHYKHDASDPHGLAEDVVVQILETSDQQFWVLCERTLHLYDRKLDRFTRYTPEISGEDDLMFTGVNRDPEGRFWLLELGNRIWRFNPETKKFISYELLEEKSESRKELHVDESGDLWVLSTIFGLYRFFPDDMRLQAYPVNPDGSGLSGKMVEDVLEHPKGTLLIAVDQGGLNLLDKETQRFSYQSVAAGNGNGLISDGVISFHKDDEGILWVGTSRQGISYHNPNLSGFETFRRDPVRPETSLANNVVGCIFEAQDGRILVGTDGGGVSVLYPKNGSVYTIAEEDDGPKSLRSNVIRKIDQGRDGRFWVATWNGGIHVVNEVNGRWEVDLESAKKLEPYESTPIWDFELDGSGRLWICDSRGGVHLLDEKLDLVRDFSGRLRGTGGFSPSVTEASNGEIHITNGAGVSRYDEETGQLVKYVDLPDPRFVSPYPEWNEYWVGTRDRGVLVFNEKGQLLQSISEEDGLPSSFIHSLERVNVGEAWIATENGLCRMREGESGYEYTTFNKDDGLQGNQYFELSSLKSRSGRLYFGGTNGLSSFDPKSLPFNQKPPPIYVSRVTLFGTVVDHRTSNSPLDRHPQGLESLVLDWKQNYFGFAFTGISMTNSHKNLYAYKLEGFDKDWVYTDAFQRTANYTNISPGEYVFRVKASNNDGVWNEKGVRIDVIITPPFWQRTWFHVLVVVLVVAVIYGVILYRESRSRAERRILAGRVKEKTEALNLKNTELLSINSRLKESKDLALALAKEAKEANRSKSAFLATMSHEIRSPMNGVIGMAELLALEPLNKEQRKFVRVIGDSGRALLGVINDILDFSKIEAGKLELEEAPFVLLDCVEGVLDLMAPMVYEKGLNIVYVADLKAEASVVGDAARLRQVITNLISNAIKFTQQGRIELGVSVDDDALSGKRMICIKVKDTGGGMSDEQQQHLFEQYRQVDEDFARRTKGTGLGLAICKQLVEMMEGSIRVESEQGVGAEFIVEIPYVLESETAVGRETLAERGKQVVLQLGDPVQERALESMLSDWGLVVACSTGGGVENGPLEGDSHGGIFIFDWEQSPLDLKERIELLDTTRLSADHVVVLVRFANELKEQIGEAVRDLTILEKPLKPRRLYATLKGIAQPSS